MNKLKVIKKTLKQNNVWKEYKKTFKNKQMKFIFSKVALIYSPDIDPSILIKYEIAMLNSSKTKHKKMFIPNFELLQEVVSTKANWNEFGEFIYYVYQTSTFYHDKKKNISNIFINKEVKINKLKRDYFYNWMHSLDMTSDNFNKNIISIQKIVF